MSTWEMHQQLHKNRSKVAPPSAFTRFFCALAALQARLQSSSCSPARVLQQQQRSTPKGQSLLTKPRVSIRPSKGEEKTKGGFIHPQPFSVIQNCRVPTGCSGHLAWSSGAAVPTAGRAAPQGKSIPLAGLTCTAPHLLDRDWLSAPCPRGSCPRTRCPPRTHPG